MTPAALDRWLAEHVMGWTWRQVDPICAVGYVPPRPYAWHNAEHIVCALDGHFCPTSNIAQAIECAEKARADRKTGSWLIESPTEGDPSWQARVLNKHEFADSPAEALCRALHAALA